MDTDVRPVSPSSVPIQRSTPRILRDPSDEHGSFEEVLDSEDQEEPTEDETNTAEGRAVSPPLDDESGGRLNVVG